MNQRPPDQKQYRPKNEFKDEDGSRYVLSDEGGVYAPKESYRRYKIEKNQKAKRKFLRAKVRRKWLGLVIPNIIALGTFGIVSLYTYYAQEQVTATQDANDAARKGLRDNRAAVVATISEMQKQTTLLHDQLSGTEGADLRIQASGVFAEGRFVFGINSDGKTRPENIRLHVTFAYLDAVSGKSIQWPKVLHKIWPTWQADSIQAMNYQPQVFQLDSPIWQRFTNGEVVLRTTGTLSWPNGFGDPRSIEFCYQEFTLTDPQQPNGNTYQHRGPWQCDQTTLREDFTRIAQGVVREKASLKAEQEARHKH